MISPKPRKPYERPRVSPAFPLVQPTPLAELGDSAALIVAVTALDAISEALDDDADETGVALYNPRHTVAKIREVLARANLKLRAVKP